MLSTSEKEAVLYSAMWENAYGKWHHPYATPHAPVVLEMAWYLHTHGRYDNSYALEKLPRRVGKWSSHEYQE